MNEIKYLKGLTATNEVILTVISQLIFNDLCYFIGRTMWGAK